MFDNHVFAARLRELRISRKMTQKDVGDLLGITATQAGDIERGKTTTSMARLYELSQHFNVSADYLLGLTDEPRPLREESDPD